jgi:cellulose synthase/poly-beta-1,6-N-acetylglucosamine synthase-like glycosyltransferase
MITTFWLASLLLVYTYVIYPLILGSVRINKQTSSNPNPKNGEWPAVDVVLSAYNEEQSIAHRLDNLLTVEYPGELHIHVASDGSRDQTATILNSYRHHSNISIALHKENRGKVTVLNELVENCQAELIVFTDANTDFKLDTITQLVASFEANVGAVCGELHLYNPEGNQNSDSLYWRYEQFLKQRESELGALLGANGAVYAIRRSLYRVLPTSTVVDDFCIVMNIKKQDYDVVYNPLASAYEEVAPTLSDEYGRRVRIGLGNYRALMANLWALSPAQGIFAWCYWSHKVLRWFAPHLLLTVLITNLFLLEHVIYLLMAIGQAVFYLTALFGLHSDKKGKKNKGIVAVISFFVSMNIALGHGFIKFLQGGQQGSWQRTARQGDLK